MKTHSNFRHSSNLNRKRTSDHFAGGSALKDDTAFKTNAVNN